MEVSHTNVNNVLNDRARPSADFCLSLAEVFGKNPESVLRLAGRLPPLLPEVENEQELIKLYRELDDVRRRAALDAMRGMAHRAGNVYVSPAAKKKFIFACAVQEIMATHDEYSIIEAAAKLYHNTTTEDHRYIQRFLRLFTQLMEVGGQEDQLLQIEAKAGDRTAT
jgi:hypothetical protein